MNSLQPIKQTNPELPHLGFRRYMPHPHLQLWVQGYWTAQQFNLPNAGFTETLYPDGCVSLTFSFINAFPSIQFKAKQATSKMVIQKSIDSIGIRFQPGGLFKLFSIDMNSIAGSDDNPEVLRSEINDIQYKLAELGNTNERLLKIENWLLEKYYHRTPSAGLLQHFIPCWLTPNSSFDALIKSQAISRRQLERKFQQEIGLSPAQLKQLHRIKNARDSISINPLRPLTDVAQDCGFYDQSHFIHHFQKITGQTPGQYRARKAAQKYRDE